ncbi:MAG: beta-ketoacyl-ACP synthase II [Chloroherpetonaceae bacterium]|nr:beta-ketoacyl-ACP synthase II [Chloroherpetonaceae bacterium]
MTNRRRIAITGIGAITPIGEGKDAFWESLKNGVSGAGPITGFDATGYDTTFGCEVKNFEVTKYIDKKSSLRMDRYCQFGVSAAEMAIKDSGIDLKSIDTGKFGVVVGSGIGGMITYDAQFRNLLQGGPSRVSPFFVPMMISDICAGQISIRNGLRGPNYATVSACATSVNAIIDAYMIMQLELADYMICGGAEASITPMSVAGFNSARALSTRNDDPLKASRPYDKDRDGFVIGEGSGVLLLETVESAIARGAHIYAEIVGVGMSADAHHITAPHPEGEGVILCMNMAMRTAGIKPDQVDYINTHGTSTQLGDIAELKSIKKVFGEHSYKLNISSSKSMTGHLLGAAGAIESIACVLAIANQTVPPTINIENLDPEVDVNVTPNTAQSRKIDYALNNGFGFGGHNGTIIFKRYQS